MEPDILYLILCIDAKADPNNYHRVNVFGLMTAVRSQADPPFPVVSPSFCALVILTNAQGSGELTIRVIQAQSGIVIFRTRRRLFRFVGDPKAVIGMRFHLRNCNFPPAGLYWVEVVFDKTVIARQRLWLTS